ncbi:exonuclease domain-containing protein [Polymorphospora rubra]|uniref:Exonuclease domain-containing protein n=1 Tax=Polymorphospora rubra TaxID=338584 RepID=A0A810NFJ6_9ACTN|nr:exonuclease domain-containing protein [Polymorphospora rubra]BCJ70025.1 hypothetical protein Prubr_70460 [Polymorphospora rubra]
MTNDTRYAVVDVETTGLHPERDRVLSVAVVQVDRHGTVSDSWSTLVDPGCDPGPVHIHGLTPQRLAGAPRHGEIAPQFDDLLDGLLPDLRLGTVATHWGVLLVRAHDALEDATALAGVFRHSLAAADADGVPLPLVACEQATPWIRARPPRYEGGWLNPGRLDVGGNLVQGMRIAVTGATGLPARRSTAAATTPVWT